MNCDLFHSRSHRKSCFSSSDGYIETKQMFIVSLVTDKVRGGAQQNKD